MQHKPGEASILSAVQDVMCGSLTYPKEKIVEWMDGWMGERVVRSFTSRSTCRMISLPHHKVQSFRELKTEAHFVLLFLG